MKTPEDLFTEHFEKFRSGIFRSSLEHYLETGKLSGSVLLEVQEMFKEWDEQKLNLSGIGSKRPYFKVSRNDYGKPFFFYKPSIEEGTFNCWMPVDEEFEREFNEILKAACASGGEGKGVSGGENLEKPKYYNAGYKPGMEHHEG